MGHNSHNKLFEGCATPEEFQQRFREVIESEVEVAAYVTDYLELRSSGMSEAEAAATLPGPDTQLGRRVQDMCAVVDMLIEARDASERPNA